MCSSGFRSLISLLNAAKEQPSAFPIPAEFLTFDSRISPGNSEKAGCSPAVDYNKLKVTFPPSVATHSPQQTFYLDETGLLRRQDYSVDIMGGTGSTNYATEPRDFGGLIVPTKRRIYDRQPDNRPNTEHVTVAVDIRTLALS